jgi:hypothetical protein
MRASVSFYFDKEDDGYEGSVDLSRDEVEDLDTMLYFLTEAIRASGFNYVTALGAHKEGGDIVWSES